MSKWQWLTRFVSLFVFVFSFSKAYSAGEDDTNFRFNPIVVLLGGLSASLDFRISPQWTLGPELGFINYKLTSNNGPTEDTSLRSFSLGARANWFKSGTFTDSLYISPFLTYAIARAKLSDNGNSFSNTADGVFAGAMAGYAWFWESFNVMLGGGLTLPINHSKVEVENTTGTKTDAYINGSGLIVFECSLGWTY